MATRPFIPIPGTVKVEMRYSIFNQKCENVFYFTTPELLVPIADAIVLGGKLVDWAGGHIMTAVSNAVILQSIKFTDMSSKSGWSLEYTTGLPLAGNLETTTAPLNVTAAIRMGTNERGRNFTGRNYWPAMVNSFITGNQLNSTGITALKTAYEALMAVSGIGPTDLKLAVASFVVDKALRAIGIATPVTSIAVDNNLDSQRRRLTARGQ